jgi:glutamate-1-semialdehyde 2,1-aminomutase
MGSARLPGKVLRRIAGRPMIDWVLTRASRAKLVDRVVVATSDNPRDDDLVEHVRALGYTVVRGNEHDVLSRYVETAIAESAAVVVRVTADCPFIDPALIDKVVAVRKANQVDYASNIVPATFPDGLDVEVFTRAALEQADLETSVGHDREHVTPYLRRGPFHRASITHGADLSGVRWTVDEAIDLEVVERLAQQMQGDDFSWLQALSVWETNPSSFSASAGIARNEGAHMGSGQKLWRRATQIIPGGNMLLSKRPEMFLPDQWPAYFSRARGCNVWDLDGKKYTDMSIMGVGTNILGYGHPGVDEAVRGVVDSGNMSTLNAPEEVWLAEKLIELHPWADMARFARSGGEANAIAIRIARAASGKDKVAICGYHGWHDWYLSANLADDQNLDGHLLPGLAPRGIPRNLRGTVYPFAYNDTAQLEALLDSQDIGAIKMEVSRNEGPLPGYLERVRELATARGIVLIFDECTSGFRETLGGLHKKYGVSPDMATFGKALGNGYAITATIGRREIMDAAQSTFISSTFWTERIGSAAALKTLEVMELCRSWEQITETGGGIRDRWQRLADKHGVKIEHWGLPALTGFTIAGPNALAYKTLVTQEMLQKDYLASNCVYVSIEHTPKVIDDYFEALDPVFALIGECEAGRDVHSLLKGPISHAGFKRLN